MPTNERKSKYDKSKSIYKKRRIKDKEYFERYNFEKQFIDGIKVKLITKKIINNLIIQKNVVSIFGEYEVERAIIISQNEKFLVLIDFSEDYIFGKLGIYYIKFIINIELLKNPKANLIKSNFNIYNLQYQYFNYLKIPKLPIELIKKIKDYVNVNNYLEYSKLSEKNNKELFLFICEKINIPCSIYVEDIEPELFGKLYNITYNDFDIKSIDLNHVFYTDLININMNNIEYISLNIFNRNKKLEEYCNNNNNFVNIVLNKIDINLKFINIIDNTYIENKNELFNIEYNEIKKIYYLYENKDEIEYFKKGYVHSKNIIDNIKQYNIDFKDYNFKNDYVDIILEDSETINNVIILEDNNEYLIVIGNDGNFKVFKKYIKNIIKNYNVFREEVINSYVNDNFEGKCVWIETIFFGWCFIVKKVNRSNIIVSAIDSKCIISNRTYVIDIKDIIYIEFQYNYFNFINDCYNKYKNDSVLKNYQQVCNAIVKNKKEYFDNKIGLEWILGNLDFYIRPEIKLLFCSIFCKTKKYKLNFCYELSSFYKIIENSYDELD